MTVMQLCLPESTKDWARQLLRCTRNHRTNSWATARAVGEGIGNTGCTSYVLFYAFQLLHWSVSASYCQSILCWDVSTISGCLFGDPFFSMGFSTTIYWYHMIPPYMMNHEWLELVAIWYPNDTTIWIPKWYPNHIDTTIWYPNGFPSVWLPFVVVPQVLIQLEGSKKPPFGLRLTDFFRRLNPEKCSWHLRSSRITLRHGEQKLVFFCCWFANFEGHPKGNFYHEEWLPWKIHMEFQKNGSLVQMIFCVDGVIFRFQSLIFRGVVEIVLLAPAVNIVQYVWLSIDLYLKLIP